MRRTVPMFAVAALWWTVALGGQELPPGPGADPARSRCLGCHGPGLITGQRLSRDGWSRELDKMAGWGASIDAADRPVLLEYLTSNFGPESPPGDARADAGAALVQARCLVCHDLRLIEQQRLDPDGWRRELDKMIGWGAAVTPEEKETLVVHLARRYGVRRPAVRATLPALP
ncbi:MAG: hypothetical protein HYY76_17380 [Acidobacteria bacterium]|nr:hypothetical protein [Acidobacteriota bacterium]